MSDSGVGGAGVRLTNYAYDANLRLTTISVTDAFDKRNNTGTAGPQVVFGYDSANRMTSESRTIGGSGMAITTSFTYDNADRSIAITHQISGGASIDSLTYTYDSGNRVTAETNQEGSVTYSYDNTNQLTGVSGARAETYTYDSNGNRTMTGYGTGTGNKMTSGGGYTFTYDNSGNMTGKTLVSNGNNWAYTWDYRNRLTGAIEHNSGGSVLMQGTYTYDSQNRRIGVDETVSGVETKTWTVYDGLNVYADFNGSGTLLQRYLDGPAIDQILARTSSGGTTGWYLTDRLGSIRDIVNTSGTVLDHLSYDAYGNVLSESNSANGDKFKFDGMQFDAAINLYYDNARWYDAGNGRFVSIDPTGFAAGDQNLYRYVGNGPLIATDPTGLQDDPASTLESDAQMKNYKDYMEAQAAATKKLLELRDPQKEPESSTYVNSYADHVREGYYPGMNNVPSNYKRVTGTYYYYPENRQKGEPKRFYYYPPTNEPRRNLPQAIFYYGPNNPNNFIRFGPTSRSPRFYPNGTVSVPNGAGWGVPFQCGPGFTLTPTGPQSLPIPIAMPTL